MSEQIKIKPEVIKATKNKKNSSSFSYSSFANTKENITKVNVNYDDNIYAINSQKDLIAKKTAQYKQTRQKTSGKKFQPIEFISPISGRVKKPKKLVDQEKFTKNVDEKIKHSNNLVTKKLILTTDIANTKNDIDIELPKQNNKKQNVVNSQHNTTEQKMKKLTSSTSDFDFIGEENVEYIKTPKYKTESPFFNNWEEDNEVTTTKETKSYFDDSYRVYESFMDKVDSSSLNQNDYLSRKAKLVENRDRGNDPFKYFSDEHGFVFSTATKIFYAQVMPQLVQKQPELIKIDDNVKHYTDTIENEFLTARRNYKQNSKIIEQHQQQNSNKFITQDVSQEPLRVNKATRPSSDMQNMGKNLIKQSSLAPTNQNYTLPALSLLNPVNKSAQSNVGLNEKIEQLETFFKNFKINAKVENSTIGPTVARFELSIAAGTKVSKISNLKDDIKLALASKDVRIEAPIPGKNLIGIEIPAMKSRTINIKELIQSSEFKNGGNLEAALGLSIDNIPTFLDIASMPHGLISGSTGSGKSVSINALLISLLYKNTPNDLKLILVDPKVVELSPYNGIPHLLSPVISDPKEALNSLKWAAGEMDRRYNLFAQTNTRNLEAFNKISNVKMPKIVIVIDELADLMMVASNEVEVYITRIAQKSRAAGIHMILATQRPSVEVITGLIKANIPTRIAFAVSSSIDSRTILDQVGAESLLGKGDMLFSERGKSPIRLQAPYITDDEISHVIEHWKNFRGGELVDFNVKEASESNKNEKSNYDPDLDKIAEFVIASSRASTSLIQRKFGYGYNKAARMIDQLEELGVIGMQNGTKPREVYLTKEEYYSKRGEDEGN